MTSCNSSQVGLFYAILEKCELYMTGVHTTPSENWFGWSRLLLRSNSIHSYTAIQTHASNMSHFKIKQG